MKLPDEAASFAHATLGQQCAQSLDVVPNCTDWLGAFQCEPHQGQRLILCSPASATPPLYQTQRPLLHNTPSSPPHSLHLPLPPSQSR